MSLTQRQIELIQQSFAQVEPIADEAAAIFYRTLFTYDPDLKPLFKTDLKDQGKKLMSVLKVAVKGLNDLDKLVPVLQTLALRHTQYGVHLDDYTPVGDALIATLSAGLGEDFTEETQEAWIQVYGIIAEVMRKACDPDFDPQTYTNSKHYFR
jgi:hemoglobin-like flavoprotein